jgi:hypothetical protein
LFHLAGSINDAEIHDITRARTTKLVAILVERRVLSGEVREAQSENYFFAEAIRKPIGLEAQKKC